MTPRRWILVSGLAIVAVVVVGAIAVRGDPKPQRLQPGVLPIPPAARLLSCGPRFDFAGTAYQVRSMTPFPPAERLGEKRLLDCEAPGKQIPVSIHAFSSVDPRVAVGVRNGMTVLALAPSRCLGLVDDRLIRCLRSTG